MSDERRYAYLLPDKDSGSVECATSINSLIIIGANGSGKSKLGAWMERQNGEEIHRVGAQRSLTFSEHIPLKSRTEAEGELFYGTSEKRYWKSEKNIRWNWGKGHTTMLIQDFDAALSALIARYNAEVQRYFEICKRAEEDGATPPRTPSTPLDRLYEVWAAVFPQRQIVMRDASFISVYQNEEGEVAYPATEMSDGERSVLYLAAQVLCIPENKTIIVDEPEIHLHPSLMGRLWRALESVRPDCFFIFITHDVRFASLHNESDKVWVKKYDGQSWDWAYVPNSDLPDQLLLELLGNRKNVLFVEGDTGSYDIRLYSALYPDYFIVPCGGCSQVVANTKAFASTVGLHELKAYGLIDRDYRSEKELDALERDGVYCLKVAEVENLFLVEPLLRILADYFACDEAESVVKKVKDYVVYDRFEKQLGKQICQAVIFSLKKQLVGVEIERGTIDLVAANFKEAISSISPEEELESKRICYELALKDNNYDGILGLLNEKGVASSVGHFFGVDNKEYCSKVVSLLSRKDGEEILKALKAYVPTLP